MKPHGFVPIVSVAGLLVIGHCVSMLLQQPVDTEWLALAILTLFTGSLTIRIPSTSARLSVSETFVFASVLLFGTCAGTITVALEILIAVAVLGSKERPDPHKIIFNVASAALSIWLASNAFYLAAGIDPLSAHSTPLQRLIVPLVLLPAIYFTLNSGLIAIALSIEKQQRAITIWRTNFAGLGINYFAGASLAALFVSYTRTIDLFALSIIIPLLLVSYLTFKTSLGRIEDATRHVDEIKRLYLSTIETLATAIDAKDQVTHGHIRRVQQFALALANEVGVTDRQQLEALEAAALLHDTGKLAIPEHILNKPGKLTAGEFETMKSHAPVGAEILSSIAFPFPVVPIVRHHHENWDGSGYPDGLRGTDIPIGARILAVVDCFDALTSDRPYRRRMSVEEALQILFQRRGVMYDPLVVDTFARCWPKLMQIEAQLSARETVKERARIEPAPLVSRHDRSSAERVIATDESSLTTTLEAALARTGAELAILFATDTENDCIVSVASCGLLLNKENALKMQLGHGISGWVAVNASVVVNADPMLELRDFASRHSLVRVICVPLRLKGVVSGVLSLYSTDPRGFSDDDRSYLEGIVVQLEVERGDLLVGTANSDSRPSNPGPATVH